MIYLQICVFLVVGRVLLWRGVEGAPKGIECKHAIREGTKERTTQKTHIRNKTVVAFSSARGYGVPRRYIPTNARH